MDNNFVNTLEENAPSTIKEVGIHLAYMRQDIAKLTSLVEQLPNGFATKEELMAVENRVKKLEDNHGSWWSRFGLPAMFSLLGAVLLVLVLSFLNRLK